jgi:hypothetical protein
MKGDKVISCNIDNCQSIKEAGASLYAQRAASSKNTDNIEVNTLLVEVYICYSFQGCLTDSLYRRLKEYYLKVVEPDKIR